MLCKSSWRCDWERDFSASLPRQGALAERHLSPASQGRGSFISDYPIKPGLGSNGKVRRVRDGLYPERLASNLRRDGAGRLLVSKSSQHVDTSGPKGSQSGSLPERALSPKTSYGTVEDSRQVPSPIDFLSRGAANASGFLFSPRGSVSQQPCRPGELDPEKDTVGPPNEPNPLRNVPPSRRAGNSTNNNEKGGWNNDTPPTAVTPGSLKATA